MHIAPTSGGRSILLLLTLLGGAFLAAPVLGQEAGSASEVRWFPETPVQGHLFRVEVVTDPDGDAQAPSGRVGNERLHFEAGPGGVYTALAPAPIDTQDAVQLRLEVDGASRLVSIPVAQGDYRFERLTVAPRFGAPPSPEDRERRAREAEKARGVSEAAHRTPRLWSETVVIPRDDRVTSGFGNGREFNGQVTSRHMGLDLDGEPGDTVVAATRGVVELVDEFLLAGNIVYLNHGNGLVSGYFHLSEQLVAQGDTVEAGTPIGRVGATGRVTGPHLHWVVRYGYQTLDPRSLLEILGR